MVDQNTRPYIMHISMSSDQKATMYKFFLDEQVMWDDQINDLAVSSRVKTQIEMTLAKYQDDINAYNQTRDGSN